MSLLLDASTPARVSGSSNPATTAAFSPPGQTLLIALASGDTAETFVVSGGGLTWTQIGNRNDASTCALSAWWAWNASAQTNITISSNRTGSFTAHQLRVLVFTGAESTFGGNWATAAAATVSINTSRANSWIWSILGDENGGTGQSAAANNTIHDSVVAFAGVSGGTVKQTSATLGSGVAFTAGGSGYVTPSVLAVEVREPSGAGYNPPTGMPTDVPVSLDSVAYPLNALGVDQGY